MVRSGAAGAVLGLVLVSLLSNSDAFHPSMGTAFWKANRNACVRGLNVGELGLRYRSGVRGCGVAGVKNLRADAAGLESKSQQLAASPALPVKEVKKQLDVLLETDRWEREMVTEVLEQIDKEDDRRLWKSVPVLYRRVSLDEVRLLTRGLIKDGVLDLNGNDDMEVLNVSFYSTLISCMFLSTVIASVVPDMDSKVPFVQGSVLRYVLTFGVGSLPFAFLGLGLSLPGLLQAALIQGRRLISKEFRERLIWHEAGHFLVGYCLGLPISNYAANDPILNAVQFFTKDDDNFGRLEYEEVDRLCAVSMAGVVAETIKFGDGVGGYADLSQLQVAPASR